MQGDLWKGGGTAVDLDLKATLGSWVVSSGSPVVDCS